MKKPIKPQPATPPTPRSTQPRTLEPTELAQVVGGVHKFEGGGGI